VLAGAQSASGLLLLSLLVQTMRLAISSPPSITLSNKAECSARCLLLRGKLAVHLNQVGGFQPVQACRSVANAFGISMFRLAPILPQSEQIV